MFICVMVLRGIVVFVFKEVSMFGIWMVGKVLDGEGREVMKVRL